MASLFSTFLSSLEVVTFSPTPHIIALSSIIVVTLSRSWFLGSLFTPGGSNQKAANGIIHAIEDVIYPYVSEEQATTQRPLPEVTR